MRGKAAVAIWCDVAFEVREEFDDWHAHEHMPERLAIPGFLRGSRWVAEAGEGYFVLYEVQDEAVLTSAAYLERLNHPTPWTRKMMPHHRNMMRGLCRVEESYGAALGHALLSVRFSAPAKLQLAALPSQRGLVGAHLLRAAAQAPQTAEQKLRGGDTAPDRVLLINGYSMESVAAIDLVPGALNGRYRLAYVLSN